MRRRRLDRRQIAVGQFHIGGLGVVFQIGAPLGAGDRHDPLRQQPGQCQLRRCDALGLRQLGNLVDDRQIRRDVLLGEPGQAAARVVGREIVAAPDLPGQEAASQRGERDEPDAQFPYGRQHAVVLHIPGEQGVLRLECGQRMHRVGPADQIGARLRDTDVTHLARPHHLAHRADALLDGDVRVDAVQVVQIDDIHAEVPQGAVHRPVRVRGAAVVTMGRAVVVELGGELGGDRDLVTPRAQGASDQFLVLERAVCLGRVDMRDPDVDGPVERGDGLLLVPGAVPDAHAHRAQALGGDGEALRTEFHGFHDEETPFR